MLMKDVCHLSSITVIWGTKFQKVDYVKKVYRTNRTLVIVNLNIVYRLME